MKMAICELESISPYSQSKFHDTPKLEKETSDDYEWRTWREKVHADKDGKMFIPPMQFKNSLAEAARYLSLQIPGKGKATYTKHFKSGVLVTEGLKLPFTKDDVPMERISCGSQGAGSTRRVTKNFPVIQEWKGEVSFYILDDTITESIFSRILSEAGNFIGIGKSRPSSPNGYFYGRYKVNKVEWCDM